MKKVSNDAFVREIERDRAAQLLVNYPMGLQTVQLARELDFENTEFDRHLLIEMPLNRGPA